MSKICEWFHHNAFEANPEQFHFLLNPCVNRPIKITGSTIKASQEEVLLGVRIDSDSTFKEHITSTSLKIIKKFMH